MAVRKLKRNVLPSKATQKNVQSTVYIAPSTPLPAALKRVDSRLVKGKVRVIGMGRAIQTVLQIAAALKSRKYLVDISTVSLTAVDEIFDEDKAASTMKERAAAAVELIVLQPKVN